MIHFIESQGGSKTCPGSHSQQRVEPEFESTPPHPQILDRSHENTTGSDLLGQLVGLFFFFFFGQLFPWVFFWQQAKRRATKKFRSFPSENNQHLRNPEPTG